MNILLTHLRSFRAVVDHGGFSAAGRVLGLSQPVVSGHVQLLEAELGLTLLSRTTRHVGLTPAGQRFLTKVEAVVDDLDRAVWDVRSWAEAQESTLRLAAPPLLSATFLPEVIAAYQVQRPEVKLSLLDMPTAEIIAAMRNGEIDACLGTMPDVIDGAGREVVMRDPMMLFASKNAPAPPTDWAGICAAEMILLRPGSEIRRLADRAAQAAGHSLNPTFEVRNVQTALSMVEAGLGVSIMPSYSLAGLGMRALAAFDLPGSVARREIVFATAPHRRGSPAVGAFLTLLRARIRAAVPVRDA